VTGRKAIVPSMLSVMFFHCGRCGVVLLSSSLEMVGTDPSCGGNGGACCG